MIVRAALRKSIPRRPFTRITGRNLSNSTGSRSESGTGGNGKLVFTGLLTATAGFFAAKTVYDVKSPSSSNIKAVSTSEPKTHSIDSWVDKKYGKEQELKQAIPEFIALLGEDGVSTDHDELHSHGYSEYSTYNTDKLPFAVVYPNDTQQVSEIAKICHKFRLPMIGYSGGTSLEGHFNAPFGGVCVDFANMDKILEIRPDDMDCTVQPAVGWMDLNQQLEDRGDGLFFAVDPGPTAKIGGMVSTNCSGTNCVRYGPMRNHVVNMTVVLADGSIIKTRQRPKKTSAGYNLNHLFAGAEGTLGLITEITVRLEPIPEKTSVAICSFPTIQSAASAAMDVIRQGVPVHAVELMDDVQMWCINRAGYTNREWSESPTLFFKFSGTPSYVSEQIEQAKEITGKHECTGFEFAADEKEKHEIWKARKESLYSVLALGPEGGKVYTTDISVPLSRLADLVELVKKDIVNIGVFGSCLGHVGDSNFHSSIVYTPDQFDKVQKVAQKAVEHGLALEGTCTGEHGVGLGKTFSLVDELGVETVSVMATIKNALDPLGLMNPGKIFTKESIEYGTSRSPQN